LNEFTNVKLTPFNAFFVEMHAVHYVGTLLDGTKLGSARDSDSPVTFSLGQGE
jgi:hypothetical protein